MTAVFLSIIAKLHHSMSTKQHSRRISSKKLRAFLNDITDQLCTAQDRMTIVLTGNTFNIHLDGGTVNITIDTTGKGGEA